MKLGLGGVCQVTHVLELQRLKSLRSQCIELPLSDCPVVCKALQNLAAESLAVVDNKIKGAVLRRRLALIMKHELVGCQAQRQLQPRLELTGN